MGSTLKWNVAQKLEKQWWKSYLSDKQPDEYLAWKKKYWESFFKSYEQLVPIKTASSIADIGCGPAGIFTFFEFKNITAVDPLLEQYGKELPVFEKSKYPNVEFVNSSLEKFKPKTPFDIVFCLNAINHVHNLELSFKRLNEITVIDGQCLLSIDVHNFEFLKLLFRAIPGDALHPHQYNLREYKEFFSNAGFEIENSQRFRSGAIFDYYVLLGRKVKEV